MLTGENQSLTCIHERDPEKLSESPKWLKYHPQLMIKDDVEGEERQLREVPRKSTVNKGDRDADLS